jgi:hypothetical protein
VGAYSSRTGTASQQLFIRASNYVAPARAGFRVAMKVVLLPRGEEKVDDSRAVI